MRKLIQRLARIWRHESLFVVNRHSVTTCEDSTCMCIPPCEDIPVFGIERAETKERLGYIAWFERSQSYRLFSYGNIQFSAEMLDQLAAKCDELQKSRVKEKPPIRRSLAERFYKEAMAWRARIGARKSDDKFPGF